MRGYLSSLVNLSIKHSEDVKYKKSQSLFRGVPAGFIDIDKYKINQIHYWPKPTSTSKNAYVASTFGYGYGDKYFLFEILMN